MAGVPTEDQEQVDLIAYLDLRQLRYFRVPNETFTRSWKQRVKNKRLGVRPGVPDLFVVVAGRLVAVEMKRTKGSTTSAAQKEWLAVLNAAGVQAQVCKGWLAAKAFIERVEEENRPEVYMGRDGRAA